MRCCSLASKSQHDVVVDLLMQAKPGGADHQRVHQHHGRHVSDIFAGFHVQPYRQRQYAGQDEPEDVASVGRQRRDRSGRNARDQERKECLAGNVATAETG